MKQGILLAGLFLSLSLTLHAQNFSSGSTGADGALDLATCSTSPCVVQLPESGVLNYTTVNIPAGKAVVFKRNSRNTPVYMLAQGSVNIAGAIKISAGNFGFSSGCIGNSCEGRVPGPGGFYGGDVGQPGFGPGGGAPDETGNGKWVGTLSLVPIVGGSGGGGGSGSAGGGGGGAIVIASSSSITVTGQVEAVESRVNFGRLGSGGAIRLVANSLNVAGTLYACSVAGQLCGVIRLEAPSGALTFTGSSTPAAVLSPINPAVVSSALPSLTIISIGGHPVPSYAGSRFDAVDLLLPNQLPDPINVVVRGNNIPVSTQVNIGFVSGSGQATSAPGTLSGTFENSTATATISGLNRIAVTYLLATATFDPPTSAANFNPKGPDQVSKIRVEAAPGAKPKYVFLRNNGTAIDTAKLSPQFLQQFAQ